MELIRTFGSIEEAETISAELESKGVLTYVSSTRSHELSPALTGAINVGLWVTLDSQYDDAVAFINNKEHKITSGISVEEIAKLKWQASKGVKKSLNQFLIYASSGVAFIIILASLLYYFLVIKRPPLF